MVSNLFLIYAENHIILVLGNILSMFSFDPKYNVQNPKLNDTILVIPRGIGKTELGYNTLS